MNILAIARQIDFSPNLVSSDAAILDAVVNELQQAGHQVAVVTEPDFLAMADDDIPATIIHMARRADTLRRLAALGDAGRRVVNDPRGVECCARDAMTRIFDMGYVPQPEGCAVPTAERWFCHHPEWDGLFPGWLKRCDYHAIDSDDVAYVATPAEADACLAAYHSRGINRVVYQQHLHGDLIKFYGVAGTDFFYWFYPQRVGHTKFGLEQHNDALTDIQFDEATLRAHCHHAADMIGVSVYGGDCIIGADGRARIIDFNDWPSFAPCRTEAAKAIAHIVTRE